MTGFAWRLSPRLALLLAPMAAALAPSGAIAACDYAASASCSYTSGPTRPLDGSPRSGVYSAQPAPRYAAPRDAAPRGLISSYGAPPERPAIWNGLYAGVQGSYRWANTSIPGSIAPDLTTRGAQLGGHFGMNFQSDRVVIGLESDLMLGSAAATSTGVGAALSMRDSWTSTFRARAGYAFGNVLVYGTGGVAMAGQDVTLSGGGSSTQLSDVRLGYVVGGGFEYKVTPQISTRLEGLHYGYKDAAIGLAGASYPVRQSSNTLKAGVSFHFN